MHGVAGYPAIFIAAMLLIGFGSAFYHASLSFVGQFLDVMGMYFIATFVILFAVGRLHHLRNAQLIVAYLAANVLLGYLLLVYPGARRYAFALVLMVGLIVERIAARRAAARGSGILLVKALLIMFVAFGIWTLDITRTLCAPMSLLQGHAVWHILGAAASWMLYRYYRSIGEPQMSQTR